METAADFRRQATAYRKRALMAAQPAAQGMLLAMANEFERDARLAEREEQRAKWRLETAAKAAPRPMIQAA